MAKNLVASSSHLEQISLLVSTKRFMQPPPPPPPQKGRLTERPCFLSSMRISSPAYPLNHPHTFLLRSEKTAKERHIYTRKIAAKEVMAEGAPRRYAVVTGANGGIGLEVVRQLAAAGVTVVLTSRNENRGREATSALNEEGLSNVVFHQLDVQDTKSIESLAKFIEAEFGWLDILVNNAGVSGVVVNENRLRALNIDPQCWLAGKAVNLVADVIITTYEKAKECLETNYYGARNVTQTLLPLLQLSTSGARIVNVSSLRSELRRVPSEQTRKELEDIESLSEEKVDGILQRFLHDLKHEALEANGWQTMLPAYSISKAALNAYTRLLARRYPQMCINCVHPGFVNTKINWNTGTMTLQQGAEGPVMLALLPKGGPTGCYYDRTQIAEF